MTAFQYKDICYPSEVEALSAFVSSRPSDFFYNQTSGLYFYSITNATVNSSGLISFSIRNSTGGIGSGFTYQLSPCSSLSSSYVFDKMPVQDMIFAAAFVMVFVIGIFQGHKS